MHIFNILDSKCYLASVGDSRAILSKKFGTEFQQLTKDHKPNNE